MGRKRLFIPMIVTLGLIICGPLFGIQRAAEEGPVPNTVVVMGMIHGGHRTSETFSIDRLKQLIRQIDPDYVLTEIPPDRLDQATRQFTESGQITESRVRVFPEYVDALFPLTREMDFEIVPCAAWTKEMNDSRRATLARLPEAHPEQYREMVQARSAIASNISKLGDSRDPAIIHTDQYDQYVRQGMQPYDKYFNELIGAGGWSNINAAHYALIEKALDQHTGRGQRFLITFGSWHKYYIKEQLAKRTDINIVPMSTFLKQNKEQDQEKKAESKPMSWNQFRGQSNRSGAIGNTEIRQPGVSWRFDTGQVIESSPVIDGDLVFIGGHSQSMHAVEIDTGKLRWKFETDGWVRATPSIANGVVYFGSDDNMFYALNAKSGEKKWSFQLGEGGQQSTPAIVDGVVYFGAFDNFVYALDAESGELKWKTDAGGAMLSSPAYDNDSVYIATEKGELVAIDRQNGDVRWKFKQNDRPIFSSPLVADGIVYVGSYDKNVWAVSAKDGKLVWNFETEGEIFSSPALVGRQLYIGSNDGHLYALDGGTGKVKWKANLNGPVFSSPAVSDKTVFVGSSDGHVYAVERESGEIAWKFLVGQGVRVWTSPAAVNGFLYFGSHAGQLVRLENKE